MADATSFRTLPTMERLRTARLPGEMRIVNPPLEAVRATTVAPAELARLRPNIEELMARRPNEAIRRPMPFPIPAGPPTTPPPTPEPTAPVTPTISADNPFLQLPRPNPGDRIKADDFRTFSRCLDAIQRAAMLSASLFSRTLGEARPLIAAERLTIERVMSVFGTVLGNVADASLDQRRVVQVIPIAFGESRLLVIVSEAVETRRLTPNLMNLTYAEAGERLRAAVGEATFPSASVRAGQLVGITLGEAARAAVSGNP
jgi:hypothetical protein